MRHQVRSISILRLIVATLSLGVATAAQAAVVGPPQEAASQAGARPKPPTITGEACTRENGVTVVLDFRNLRSGTGKKMNRIKIGCAQGTQESGFAALLDAGFDVDPDSPFVCTLDNRPIDPPTCPAPDGFWSYSHGERGGGWVLAGSGAGGWQPPAGSLEGWSWAPYDREGWQVPRVTPRELFPPLG